jgi:5-(aminomethyl)-3-furanmethanol phosphate kinase
MTAARVVKVGGSLLDWVPLAAALRTWLAGQPPAFNVLLAGGGALADVIRRADREFSLGEEASHWLCLDALSVSAGLLALILRDISLVSGYDDLKADIARGEPGMAVFDPRAFLHDHESRLAGRTLPHDWSVTSDSIAARLATVLQADELVLLKSCDPPGGSLSELAAAGYVDRYLPVAAAAISKVCVMNLRGPIKTGEILPPLPSV